MAIITTHPSTIARMSPWTNRVRVRLREARLTRRVVLGGHQVGKLGDDCVGLVLAQPLGLPGFVGEGHDWQLRQPARPATEDSWSATSVSRTWEEGR